MYRSRLAFVLAMAALAAILLPSSLHAQVTFQRTYGGDRADYGFSVRQTSDSGYVIAGHTLSYGLGGYDIYLVKTDVRGDTLWTRTYGDTAHDEGWSVQQTIDGGYVIAGVTNSFGVVGVDVYLIKTDANGDTLWTRTFGGTGFDVGRSVQQTTDSGYIIAGYTESFGAGADDVYAVKTNASGDTQWTRTYGDSDDDYASSVQQTTDGGYIIAGGTVSPGPEGHGDVYLIRTDAEGDTLWTRTYGDSNYAFAYSVQQTTDSGYVIAGFCDGGYGDAYLIKTDASGDTQWTRTFGGASYDVAHSTQQAADGGYILTGTTLSFGSGGEDAWLMKTDSSGDTQWTRTFGDTADEGGWSICRTGDRGFIIAGYAGEWGNDRSDIYLTKTDSLGNVAVAEPKANPARASNLTIACQPNPATGATTIRLSPFALRHSPLTLRVYDAQGKLALSQPVRTSSFPLSTSDLPSGAYFIRCDFAGQHATTRIVLQR